MTGVYLSLSGDTIPNHGYVLATDIGVAGSGLLCHTDRSDCCRGSDGVAQGHWYFPDGTQVRTYTQETTGGSTTNFFFRDRSTGIVRLNRNGDPTQRGCFRCEVSNSSDVTVNQYVNIGE